MLPVFVNPKKIVIDEIYVGERKNCFNRNS